MKGVGDSFAYRARIAVAKAKIKLGDTFSYEGHTGKVIGIYSNHFVVEFTSYSEKWGHHKDKYRESFGWDTLIEK